MVIVIVFFLTRPAQKHQVIGSLVILVVAKVVREGYTVFFLIFACFGQIGEMLKYLNLVGLDISWAVTVNGGRDAAILDSGSLAIHYQLEHKNYFLA